MKQSRPCTLALLTVCMIMLIAGLNSSLVWADPCTATLGSPVMPGFYSNTNAQIVVPVSASCTTNYGNQLYATGSAYDATTNTSLSSASTSLTSVNGGTEFNGQLTFNLPSIPQSDSIQFSVSIYDSQYGNLLTQAGEPFELGAGAPAPQGIQVTTTTVTQNQYPPQFASQYPSPSAYEAPYNQAPYQTNQPQYQSHHTSHAQYLSGAVAQSSNSVTTLDYVVIIAIFAAVIIATASLVLVAARRQPSWPPPPPPLVR